MPGKTHNGRTDAASAIGEIDFLRVMEAQPLGCRGRDVCCVFPDDFCHRLGQFLQPGIVGESPVIDVRVGPDKQFKS